MAHQISQPSRPFAVDPYLFFVVLLRREAQRHLAAAPVRVGDAHAAGAHRTAAADHLAVRVGAMALAQRAVVRRLQQVGLAGAVLSEKEIHPPVRPQRDLPVIPEITQPQLLDPHVLSLSPLY